ncbi:alpha/beta fold hydrolase [Candidatus Neomarinimicrobiota bacterium]
MRPSPPAAIVLLILLALLPLRTGAQCDISPERLKRRYAMPPSQFVPVDGMAIHVRDQGTGPAVVLLHGMFSSLHTWDGWVAALQDSFRLIRLDLPGFGLTGPRPDADYSLPEYVGFLDLLLDELGVERAFLVGNSLGGGIAWEYSLAHPSRVEGLILIDAVGYPRDSTPRIMVLGAIPGIRHLFRIFTPRLLVKRVLRGAYADRRKITPELVNRYHDLIRRKGNRAAFLKMLRQPYPYGGERIPHLKAVTLIMWGEQDEWIPVKHAYLFHADLPYSHLVTYPNAGHAPMEELPDRTAADARIFLRKILE